MSKLFEPISPKVMTLVLEFYAALPLAATEPRGLIAVFPTHEL